MKKILLIGLGPHAKHHYIPLLRMAESLGIAQLSCVFDLKSCKDRIDCFLRDSGYFEVLTYFLPDSQKDDRVLCEKSRKLLSEIVLTNCIDKVIIATEAKAHESYIRWALAANIDFLTDKPLLVSTYHDVLEYGNSLLYSKYKEFEKEIIISGINASMMALRRTHPAIQVMIDYLRDFLNEWKVPITHINIFHGEGMWNMPNEYEERENHPYKHGYGSLFHTGYHFVDLMMYLLALNSSINKSPDSVDLSLSFTRPSDIDYAIGKDAYKRLLDLDLDMEVVEKHRTLGEVDWQGLFSFKQNGNIITTANLDIRQTNYSRRSSKILPEDVYKGNGRTYHEIIDVEVAHLLSIRILRMNIAANPKDQQNNCPNRYEDFLIEIYRNTDLVGGTDYEEILIPANKEIILDNQLFYMSIGDYARWNTLCDWLVNNCQVSSIISHAESMLMFDHIHTLLSKLHNQNLTQGTQTVSLSKELTQRI